jgi:hypothetical protein
VRPGPALPPKPPEPSDTRHADAHFSSTRTGPPADQEDDEVADREESNADMGKGCGNAGAYVAFDWLGSHARRRRARSCGLAPENESALRLARSARAHALRPRLARSSRSSVALALA